MNPGYQTFHDRVDADYNTFGYDPDGWLAHLAAHFFGPDWRTAVIRTRLPRYGPPVPHQVSQLPPNFRPQPPPNYYGPSYPSYIEAPRNFCLDAFVEFWPRRWRMAVQRAEQKNLVSRILNIPSTY